MKKMFLSAMLAVAFIAIWSGFCGKAEAKERLESQFMVLCGEMHVVTKSIAENGEWEIADVVNVSKTKTFAARKARRSVVAKKVSVAPVTPKKAGAPVKNMDVTKRRVTVDKAVGVKITKAEKKGNDSVATAKTGAPQKNISLEKNQPTGYAALNPDDSRLSKASGNISVGFAEKGLANSKKPALKSRGSDIAQAGGQKKYPGETASIPGTQETANNKKRLPGNNIGGDVRRYQYIVKNRDINGNPVTKKITVTHESWTNLPDYREVKRAFVWLPGQVMPPEWMSEVGGRMSGIDPETGQIWEMEIPTAIAINYNNRGSAVGVVGKYSKVPDDRHLLKKIWEERWRS